MFFEIVSDMFGATLEFFSLLPGTVTALLVMLCNAVPVLRMPLETLEGWLEPVGLWMVVILVFFIGVGWLFKGFKVKWVKKAGTWVFRVSTIAFLLVVFWLAGKLTGIGIKSLL